MTFGFFRARILTHFRAAALGFEPKLPGSLAIVSTLTNFHRIRGMVRLLARTAHLLWRDKPVDSYAIHPHHIDPGYGSIRDEFTTRLGMGEFAPALKADIAAVPGDDL